MYILFLMVKNIIIIYEKGGMFLKSLKMAIVITLLSLLILSVLNLISIEVFNTFDKERVQNILDADKVYAQTNTRDSAQLLARAINGEARGEPYIGQVAVGAVILNRVSHPSFPKSIPGVIYQPGAFTAVSDGQINIPLSTGSSAYKAAKDCMNGWDPSGGAIYYYNPAKTTNAWIWSRTVVTTIGKHKFAK